MTYDDPVPTLEADIEQARRRFIAWVRWFLDTYPDRVKGQADLAEKIGISQPSLSLILTEARGKRCPSMETLIGFERFTGIAIQALLHTDPPASPPRK